MSSDDPTGNQFLDALGIEATRLRISFSASQRSSFARYLELLEAWNERAGLTAIDDRAEVATRLFGESLALLVALREAAFLDGDRPVRIADIGPGGGFPGVPMRIADPSLQLVLIESQRRRCAFLEALTADLALDGVEVVHARAEEAGRREGLRGSFDVVVARAVAPLNVLVEYALPLLRDGGVLAAPKGSRAADELVEAQAAIVALGGTILEPLALSLPAGVLPQQIVLVRRDGELDDRFPRRAGMPSKRPLR